MKIMFISDIHGSLTWLNKALDKYKEEGAEQIVLLGDVLYHGPRNPLPEGYNPKEVAEVVNANKEKFLAVRGNCDSEVDQMVLEIPIMADYAVLFDGHRKIFATHGHLFNKDKLPQLREGDVLVHGHTHLPVAEKYEHITLCNPGSISYPKENNPHSYGILEDGVFKVIDFDGNCIREVQL